MNNEWSALAQGIDTLDKSRNVYFRDDKSEMLLGILGLKEGMDILECGCGTGVLARKIYKWLNGNICLTGIDKDTGFITYADRKAANFDGMKFIEGDVHDMPLCENSFDAIYSHTVIEHVSNREFLKEQKRICRPGGRVSVMITLGGLKINSLPPELPVQSEREKELFKPILEILAANNKHIGGGGWLGYYELPRLFEEVGFVNIHIDTVALPVVTDDDRNSYEQKKQIVSYNQKTIFFDNIKIGKKLLGDDLSESDVDELKGLIDKRFNKRMKFIDDGFNLWDYTINTTLIISGCK